MTVNNDSVISLIEHLGQCWRRATAVPVTKSLAPAQKRFQAHYNSLANTVDLKMSHIDAADIPWLRSTRNAYSSLEHDVNKPLT